MLSLFHTHTRARPPTTTHTLASELFYACFDQPDQKRGMAAFVAKQAPAFSDAKLPPRD